MTYKKRRRQAALEVRKEGETRKHFRFHKIPFITGKYEIYQLEEPLASLSTYSRKRSMICLPLCWHYVKQQEGWGLWRASHPSSFQTQPHQPDKMHHEKYLIKQQKVSMSPRRQEAHSTKGIKLGSRGYFFNSVA